MIKKHINNLRIFIGGLKRVRKIHNEKKLSDNTIYDFGNKEDYPVYGVVNGIMYKKTRKDGIKYL